MIFISLVIKCVVLLVHGRSDKMQYNAHDWPEDFKNENGNYLNTCSNCKYTFKGNRGRTLCKCCFNKISDEAKNYYKQRYGEF